MSGKVMILLGSLLAFLAVFAGAAGAHIFKQYLHDVWESRFHTAVQYHMTHAIALVITGLLALRQRSLCIRLAGLSFFLGIVLFSGSLYAAVLSQDQPDLVANLIKFTPTGGVLLMLGWLLLAVGAFNLKSDRADDVLEKA